MASQGTALAIRKLSRTPRTVPDENEIDDSFPGYETTTQAPKVPLRPVFDGFCLVRLSIIHPLLCSRPSCDVARYVTMVAFISEPELLDHDA